MEKPSEPATLGRSRQFLFEAAYDVDGNFSFECSLCEVRTQVALAEELLGQ